MPRQNKTGCSKKAGHSAKKAIRTRIASDLVNYGETQLSSPSSSEDENVEMAASKKEAHKSLSDVASFLTRTIKYDFGKQLDSVDCFSFAHIVDFLVEWLNGNKFPFSRVREFFEEETGKTGHRPDGTKAARLFTVAYWEKFSVRDKLIQAKFPGYIDGRKTKKSTNASSIDKTEHKTYQKKVNYMREYKFPVLILNIFKHLEAKSILSSLIVATYINSHEIDVNNVPWSTLEQVIGSNIVQAAREHGVHKASTDNHPNIAALKFKGLPPAPNFEGMGEQAYIDSAEVASAITSKTSNALLERETAFKAYTQAKAEAARAGDYHNRACDKEKMAKVAFKINIDKLGVYKVDQQGRDALRNITGCGGKRCILYGDIMKLVAGHLLNDENDDSFLSGFLHLRKRLLDINIDDPSINFVASETDYSNQDVEHNSILELSDSDDDKDEEAKHEVNIHEEASKSIKRKTASPSHSHVSSKRSKHNSPDYSFANLFGKTPLRSAPATPKPSRSSTPSLSDSSTPLTSRSSTPSSSVSNNPHSPDIDMPPTPGRVQDTGNTPSLEIISSEHEQSISSFSSSSLVHTLPQSAHNHDIVAYDLHLSESDGEEEQAPVGASFDWSTLSFLD